MGSQSPLSYLEPLESRSLGPAVLAALSQMVERAGLKVGDRLPPELALAQQLGVGRSTIREALNRWEGLGLIRRKQGIGTYLAAPVPKADGVVPLMVRLEGEALLRLLEVRRSLESDVVRLATERATPAQRSEIDRLCDVVMAIVAEGGNYRPADMAFHGAICDAAGNPLFGQILARLDSAFEKSDESPFDRNGFGVESFPFHRDLADGIIANDSAKACEAIHAIIDSVDREVRQIIRDSPG